MQDGPGEMVRYMAEHQIENPEDIRAFDRLDYTFDPERSDEETYVFVKRGRYHAAWIDMAPPAPAEGVRPLRRTHPPWPVLGCPASPSMAVAACCWFTVRAATPACAMTCRPWTGSIWKEIAGEEIQLGLLDAGIPENQVTVYLQEAGEIQLTRTHGRREVAFLNRAWEDVLSADLLVDQSSYCQPLLNHAVNDRLCRCAGADDVNTAHAHLMRYFHEERKRHDEVVAALIWDENRFLACQRPHTKPVDCCGSLSAARWSREKPVSRP